MPDSNTLLPCRALGRPPSGDSNGTVAKSKKRKHSTERKQETFSDSDPGVPELLGDRPLRLIIVGTNPSGHAW